MTLKQTRQLGIEFERRIQTILPSTKIVDKIDTEDIYSFLNEYSNQFIKDLYITRDRIQPNSNASNRVDDYLKSLIWTTEYSVSDDNMIFAEDFNMYIDSTSNVEVSYSDSKPVEGVVSNDYVNVNQLKQIQRGVYDQHRILRRPVIYTVQEVQLPNLTTCFGIITDEYTKVTSITMRYLKTLPYFTILGEQPTPCELPYECFNELVNGAVQLFINYKRGGVSQPQTASKQPQRQSNQQNNQQDEQEDEE